MRRRTRADVAFTRQRVAVFVDGCFWHRCPEHYAPPKNNAAWWQEKISRNVARDRRVDEILMAHDWLGIRFWEHELTTDPVACADRVEEVVRSNPRH